MLYFILFRRKQAAQDYFEGYNPGTDALARKTAEARPTAKRYQFPLTCVKLTGVSLTKPIILK
jgi:hypothetical protein